MTDPLDVIVGLLPTTSPAVVLVDGRSGSGKTTLSRRLLDRWDGAALLSLDDVYPGWDGLRRGADHVRENVLEPLRAGRPGSWTRWDWTADVAGPEHPVAVGSRLIVEGCGALDRRSRELADLAVWIELDAATRKRRALARDGDSFAAHWDRWAKQEAEVIASECPAALADLVIEGRGSLE